MPKDRMIVFEDMIESRTGDVLRDIGVSKDRARKIRPKESQNVQIGICVALKS